MKMTPHAMVLHSQRLVERANEALYEKQKELTGMLQTLALCVGKLGGSVTFTEQELADSSGALGISFNKETREYTFDLLVVKADAKVVVVEGDDANAPTDAEGTEA